MIPGAFLTIDILFLPLLMCVYSELPVPWKKQPARFTVPQGGSDSTNFLGG